MRKNISFAGLMAMAVLNGAPAGFAAQGHDAGGHLASAGCTAKEIEVIRVSPSVTYEIPRRLKPETPSMGDGTQNGNARSYCTVAAPIALPSGKKLVIDPQKVRIGGRVVGGNMIGLRGPGPFSGRADLLPGGVGMSSDLVLLSASKTDPHETDCGSAGAIFRLSWWAGLQGPGQIVIDEIDLRDAWRVDDCR